MTNSSSHYDVAIIGGGIVGMALACAALTHSFSTATAPLRIIILEGRSFVPHLPDNKIDTRVSAITRASENILKAVGAWPFIPQNRITPYQEMKVWEKSEIGEAKNRNLKTGEVYFNCADIAEPNLGYIVENHALQQALHHVLTQFTKKGQPSSIEMVCPALLKEITAEHNGYRLQFNTGLDIAATLVVGADGATSSLRELAGISTQGWDYHQTALVSTVQTALPHQSIARQRFLTSGPLAFLPLRDAHTCSIVWSTTPEEAHRLKALEEPSFCHELGLAFDSALGNITSAGERIIFPLRMQHVTHYVKENLALVGDAAHTLHPLAGQGVNLGLLDAACLADVIMEARNNNRNIGTLNTLRRYERWRKGHNLGMIGAVEVFKQLFSNDNIVLESLRTTGLSLTNRISPLKNFLMRQALGLIGELPSLAKKQL